MIVIGLEKPPAPLPKTQHAVQLGSGPTLDALRLNWTLLSERHKDLLASLQTRYRQSPGKANAPYQLIAGPFGSPGEAQKLCKALSAQGISCRATTFSGEAL